MRRQSILFLMILSCWFSQHSPAFAENWPQWRGLKNDGISHEKNLPTQWTETKNILWKLPLPGPGSSTPAIWGDKIFLTSQVGKELFLVCLSTEGKELWQKKMGISSGKTYRGDEGNDASASPSTDGKYVYAFVGSGDLGCYDFAGKEIWKFDVQKKYGKFNIQFGMHSTPVLYKDHLYLQLLYTGGAHVIALNKKDGQEVWKIERKSDGRAECEHSYASPCIWENGSSAYLITHGNDYAIAHSLKDGSEIWRAGDLNLKTKYNPTLRFVASPVATPDLIIVPSAKNGPVVAVKPDAKGKVVAGSKGEQWRILSNTPDVPSPLVAGGFVYLCRENGNLICLDSKDGKEYYNQPTSGGRYRASPIYADGKIYILNRDKGIVTVVEAGKEFKQLATNKLDDTFAACPAVSDGRIYLRGLKYLYAIGTK